ncbi:hypothetical protein CARUB_v10007467mg [Capsella rubella]|uniref:F-box domain-containing protein n=1 Tax=Capsella rubella TaxID=81985 RepID=R0H2F8_9BRAS|nr:F-box/kelch-repeat protein At5g39560 [Capsella rubella]EOA18845.1 hypothetical protein CARUB_v10007467mg [Capsella rubella]
MKKFSDLPKELIISILARVSIIQYRVIRLTSKALASLVASPELYAARSIVRSRENLVYYCSSDRNQVPRWSSLSKKPESTATEFTRFCLSEVPMDDPYSGSSVMVGLENSIYMLDAEDTGSRRLRVLDCSSNQWTQTEPMSHGRDNEAFLLTFGENLCVLGGIKDESKLRPEVYKPNTSQWVSLPEPDLGDKSSVILVNSTDASEIEVWAISAGEEVPAKRFISNSTTWVWEKKNSSLGRGPANGCLTVVIGNYIYRIIKGDIIRYDKTTVLWSMVQGFGEFERQPFQAIRYGSNMLAFWNVWLSEGRKEVWCTEISFEIRGDQVFGNQIWKALVKIEDKGYTFLGSTTVNV